MRLALLLAVVLLTSHASPASGPTRATPIEQAAEARRLREFERSVNGVRFRRFGAPPNESRRAIGGAEVERLLRAEPSPRKFTVAWESFARADEPARLSLLDAFEAEGSAGAWAMLAWLAVREDNALGDRARGLLASAGGAHADPDAVADIVEHGVLSEHPLYAQRAGLLAEAMDLYEAIPALIVGQIWPPEARSMEAGNADRILIRQRMPPLFENPFDPYWHMRQSSVEGESAGSGVIEVQRRSSPRGWEHHWAHLPRDFSSRRTDAQPVFHRGGTHETLVRMTTRLWGKPTDHLGWDVDMWRRWFFEELQPTLLRRGPVTPLPLWPTP